MVIVPCRDGDNFATSHIMLDIAQDPLISATTSPRFNKRVGRARYTVRKE
jgi:hypothetical protein